MPTSESHGPSGALSPQSLDALQSAFREYLRTGHAEEKIRRAMQLASAEAGARQLTADQFLRAFTSAWHTLADLDCVPAERRDAAFAGGDVEGWYAPALNAGSPSPVPWTVDALHAYLRHGVADLHAVTAGPMQEVVHDLAQANDDDVRAIATYIASLDTRSDAERSRTRAAALERAASAKAMHGNPIYDGSCADCHNRGRGEQGGALELPLGTALTIPTPRNLAYIIREGIVPPDGERGAWMPAFAGMLTDEQLTDLLIYLRALSGQPAWPDVAREVRQISRGDR
jgi:mono/diheme cytochrome c family protein